MTTAATKQTTRFTILAAEARIGVFFGSLRRTLNPILTADRIWMRRLTGDGDHPDRLNAIIHHDLADLARARVLEDRRLEAIVSAYTG